MGKKSRQEPKTAKVRDIFVARPFEGLADEAQWVALRELVPAATAPLALSEQYAAKYGAREITLATILPMAWPALTKPDGRVMLGLQRQDRSGDVNRDLSMALLSALDGDPGSPVSVPPLPGAGPRLADILADGPLQITLHDSFEFWLDPDSERNPNVTASLESANASIFPTVRMAADWHDQASAPGGVGIDHSPGRAAYWCRVPGRAHLRWVLPQAEDVALRALARLSASGGLKLAGQSRFAGMFRAHGLLAPVWDLPSEPEAAAWEEAAAGFATRYAQALTVDDPLDAEQRRARQGLVSRQLTLR